MSNYITKTGYITYECDTCGRTIDVLQDNVRVFTNGCTITKHCQGKLRPINTKTIRSVLAASENSDLVNWSGNQEAPSSKVVELPVSLNSAANVITVAIQEPSNVATIPSLFYLRFNVNTTVNSYQEYIYSLNSFTEITGADDSTISKVLKFDPQDTVLVYINGALLSIGTDYTLEYSTLDGLGYGVLLTNEVYIQSNIRIVVFTPLPAQYTNSIEFRIHGTFPISTAWSNVKRVSINGLWYSLFSSDELSLLPLNTRLSLALDSNTFSFTTLPQMKILFANPNFTAIDRVLTSMITLSDVSTSEIYFNLVLYGTSYELQTVKGALSSISPITIDRTSLITPSLETPSSLLAVSDTSLINQNTASNIIGVI